MPRKRRTEETRREEIVDAALRLILKIGFHHTTLEQVAVQANVSKGLISYYFTKKDDLFLAVLHKMISRLQEDLESCYRAPLTARERLSLNFRNLFDNERRTSQYYTVLIDFLSEALRDQDVEEYTRVIYQTVLAYIEWTIADGVRDGEFSSDVEPHRVASLLVAMMEGLVLQWMFNRDSFSFKQALDMCENVADKFLPLRHARVDRPAASRTDWSPVTGA